MATQISHSGIASAKALPQSRSQLKELAILFMKDNLSLAKISERIFNAVPKIYRIFLSVFVHIEVTSTYPEHILLELLD